MKKRILLIDNDEGLLRKFQELFSESDYIIEACQEVKLALGLIEKTTYSVIITELQMSGRSGLDLLSHPIVLNDTAIKLVYTTCVDTEIIIQVINSGQVWQYLKKSCDDKELVSTINRAIELYDKQISETNIADELKLQNKNLNKLNRNLEDRLENSIVFIDDRTRLLKLLATNDDQEAILEETFKSIRNICGDYNYRIVKELTYEAMFFPLYNEGVYLGYIVYDQVDALVSEEIVDTIRIFAPVIEVCLHILEAKSNTLKILEEMKQLTVDEVDA